MEKFCVQCGMELPVEAVFCLKCGAKQEGAENNLASKNIMMDVIGDYMYKREYKEDLMDTVIAASGSLSCVHLKSQITSKQMRNALDFCNDDFLSTDVIMVRDTTDFGSMKEGLIITYYGAYYIWEGRMQSKVKFNQIKEMKKNSGYGMDIKFTLYNGRENIFKLHSTKETLYKLFVEICDCISRHREGYPVKVDKTKSTKTNYNDPNDLMGILSKFM